MPLKPITVYVEHHEIKSTFVLISSENTLTSHVFAELLEIPMVSEVKKVDGLYDLFVELKSDSVDKIKQTIAYKIRSIEGVRTCLTLFEINAYADVIE